MESIRATYRLQLEPAFNFDQAAGIVPYLAALGVSHVYCSPVFEAVPGSRHGYDVVDPTRVRGELGGADARARFVATLRQHGLGLIADIVPNHVALEGNAWWIDVLTHGTASASFPVFDVDLSADPYAGPASAKLLIPILGEPYGRELAAGRLRLVIEHGKPLVAYAGNRFPLSITSRAALDDEPEGQGEHGDEDRLEAIVAAVNADAARLHALLEAQHYRLTWWRLARDEAPYRRFFDVNGLIGVRVEDPVVFDAMHRLVAEWVADGSIDGLRVDHVDGLADPGAYLRRLRALAPAQWIGVEKILGEGEALPPWPVDGTTGYETGALLTRLLTAAEGEGPLTTLYHRFAGALDNFDEVEEDARHEILEHWLAGDAKRVALALYRMCQDDLDLRDYSIRDTSILIRELVAGARVYRTYVSTEGATDADVTRLAALCARVRTRRPDVPEPLIDLVARLFATGGDGPNGLEFVRRFQQLSTATAAKAVEDTAAYRDVRYIALNEVGCDPRRFSVAPAEFHDTIAGWHREHPRRMHGTSTHDSKRGEDVRARLSVLSEVPELWAETVERWGRRSDAWRVDGQPDRNIEYYVYQTLVGAWPLTRERAHVHVEKAAREAKVFTDWLGPSEEYRGRAAPLRRRPVRRHRLHRRGRGLRRRAPPRRLDQGPVAAAPQADDPRRARPVSGLRALAPRPRRSGQSASGRLRVPGRAPRGVRPHDGRRRPRAHGRRPAQAVDRPAARCGSRRAIRRSPIRPRPTRRSRCVERQRPAPSASSAAATSRWWCRSAPGRRSGPTRRSACPTDAGTTCWRT